MSDTNCWKTSHIVFSCRVMDASVTGNTCNSKRCAFDEQMREGMRLSF